MSRVSLRDHTSLPVFPGKATPPKSLATQTATVNAVLLPAGQYTGKHRSTCLDGKYSKHSREDGQDQKHHVSSPRAPPAGAGHIVSPPAAAGHIVSENRAKQTSRPAFPLLTPKSSAPRS